MDIPLIVYRLASISALAVVVLSTITGLSLVVSAWTEEPDNCDGIRNLLSIVFDAHVIMIAFTAVLFLLVSDKVTIDEMKRLDACAHILRSFALELLPTLVLTLVSNIVCILAGVKDSKFQELIKDVRRFVFFNILISLSLAYIMTA